MTDYDPLAPIEALLTEWGRNIKSDREDQRAATVAGKREAAEYWAGCGDMKGEVLTDLLAALAEARQAVDALVAERDEYERRWEEDARPALAERDAAREALGRVEALARGSQPTHEAAVTEGYMRCQGDVLDVIQPATDEEAGSSLPLHCTEAGWPRCSTCDGGGCPDCTDPA